VVGGAVVEVVVEVDVEVEVEVVDDVVVVDASVSSPPSERRTRNTIINTSTTPRAMAGIHGL